MDFVGRKRELAAAARSLEQGRNLVLTGRFGVGRSSLVRQLAKLNFHTWQFLFTDFSRPASQCGSDLVRQLVSPLGACGRKGYTRMTQAKEILRGAAGAGPRRRVVVLDDIGRISPRKLAFIRDLRLPAERPGGGILFIAIAESFLPEEEIFRLRAALYPADRLALHNLNPADTAAFFRAASQRCRLGWDAAFIRMLAASTAGYPLLMRERLQRAL
jgi:hypothetical protein